MNRSMMVMGLMLISSVIFAQTKEKRHPHGEARLEKLKSELSLNDAQYASIKGINKKYTEKFSELRKDSVRQRSEKHTAIKALHDERKKEIEAVLSPDQKTKYETLKKERADKRRAAMKARSEEHHAKMTKELSLTDDQAAKVADANKAFFEKAKALRQQTDGNTNKDELKKLREEHEAKMQSIMTSEQFTKWKEMRKSMKGKHKKKGSRKHERK